MVVTHLIDTVGASERSVDPSDSTWNMDTLDKGIRTRTAHDLHWFFTGIYGSDKKPV